MSAPPPNSTKRGRGARKGALGIAQRGDCSRDYCVLKLRYTVQLDRVALVQRGISKWLNSEGLSIHKALVARRQKGLTEWGLFVSPAKFICAHTEIYL